MTRATTRAGSAALLALALLLPAVPARAAETFQLDQRYATIAFSVGNLGLFRSTGDFARFVGHLTIDLADPTATRIAVTIDTTSLQTPWDNETQMLRSPDFFDVTRYPEIHFTSRAVTSAGPGRYRVQGQISIRGITRPMTLNAKLIHESRDPATGKQIDDFIVTGELDRRAFGMTANPLIIADHVKIDIHARIILDRARGG